MVSLQRRLVIVGGLAGCFAPRLALAAEKLVLSGRLLDRDGRPLAGNAVRVGADRALTDADGRFVMVTTTSAAQGRVANAYRDAGGTWRGTLA